MRKFVASSVFFTRTSTERPVCEPSSVMSQKNQVAIQNTSESGFSLKEKILAEDTHEKQKYELLAESDERTTHELTGKIDSQRMEIDHTITGCEQSRELNYHFKKNSQNNIGIFVKTRVLHEMEE